MGFALSVSSCKVVDARVCLRKTHRSSCYRYIGMLLCAPSTGQGYPAFQLDPSTINTVCRIKVIPQRLPTQHPTRPTAPIERQPTYTYLTMQYLKLKRSKKDTPGGLVNAQSDSDLRPEQSSGQPEQAGLSPPPTTRRPRFRDRLKWGSQPRSRSPSCVDESRSNTPDRPTTPQSQVDSASVFAQAHGSYSSNTPTDLMPFQC